MEENFDLNSEDIYTDIDFEDDEKIDTELKNAEFIGFAPALTKLFNNKNEKISKFYSEDNKLLAEKIIEKKSGAIIEIKYDILGNKSSVIERSKDKEIKKITDYYENGSLKLVTEYAINGSYKSLMYNVDGSRRSFVDKHEDGTSDAVYYDVDGKGKNLIVKMDANKEVIEKHTENA